MYLHDSRAQSFSVKGHAWAVDTEWTITVAVDSVGPLELEQWRPLISVGPCYVQSHSGVPTSQKGQGPRPGSVPNSP